MALKTDNLNEVGLHVFEKVGLGKAPFRFVDFHESKFQACPDAPVQAGASCDYCGTGIMYVCVIESADGKRFKVGSDCVSKVDDAGLLKAYKTHPAVRAKRLAASDRADDRVIAAWKAIIADPASVAVLRAHKVTDWRGEEPWLDYALRAWVYCGASGRKQYLKAAKFLIAKSVGITNEQ